jgi:gag-polyprotein putative aspartyl protease
MPARRVSDRRRATGWRALAVVLPGLLACALGAAADPAATPPTSLPQSTAPAGVPGAPAASGALSKVPGPLVDEPFPEVEIEAPEPRYVAPTLRDRIGRIWAPVLIDGKGPFRLVLDTGASHSAVIAVVAQTLGMPLNTSLVRLRGVMGTLDVPAIHVSNLIVGDLEIDSTTLPIVPDALGGAQGVLGTEGLLDKRIYIDFRHDLITIKRSHGRRADFGFITIPMRVLPNHLLATPAYMGTIRVTAIIDTGAQTSIANLALRRAMLERRKHQQFTTDQIIDTTDTVGEGQGADVAPIRLGGITIRSAHLTIGDVGIFEAWKLADTPAVLIGMDALGTVDVLVIDYRRSELQILARGGGGDEDAGGADFGHPFGHFRDRDPRW